MKLEERVAGIQMGRNLRVLTAAIAVARKRGYRHMLRREIADEAGVSTGTVNSAFGTMAALREAVMRAAVEQGLNDIVAQGLADGHALARNAPPKLKQAAALALA